MQKAQKVQSVQEMVALMKGSETLYLLDFRGLSVAEITSLRNSLRDSGASVRVVKNTLAKRAASEAGLPGFDALLTGPSAVVFCGEDPVAPAKAVQAFIKDKRKLAVKGGYLQERIIDASAVEELASLPSREELVAKVVGGIASPLYAIAGVLAGPMRSLVIALDRVREQKEQAA
jgi:large subunit ribosomal protein L10